MTQTALEEQARAARPLAALDAGLAGLRALPRTRLKRPGMALGPGIAVQYAGKSGVVARAEGLGADGFGLTLDDRGASPWFSLELSLPVEALRRARFLGLRLAGAAQAGVAALHPVLRLHAEQGWSDHDAGRDFALTPAEAEQTVILSLDRMAGRDDAASATLILFLRQRAAGLRLARIDPFLAE
ncbi:hypothetical protein ACQ5SO_15590 [Rhodovulum sp. DZ06]|uniref:hypothetical protein n=1 Tax=Rhodovulum sp. DZ06 TaxID=3425126 RepID=UPI003D331110